MKLLKKIAVAQVCAVDKNFFKNVIEETPVMRVLGLVRKHEIVTTTFGDAVKFIGEFHAFDLTQDTPEDCVGPVCYLPQPVDGLLLAGLQANPGATLEFAYDISVVPDPKTTVGYQYRVRSITETAESDPMQALLKRAAATALPALTMAKQAKEGGAASNGADKADTETPNAAPAAAASAGAGKTGGKAGGGKK